MTPTELLLHFSSEEDQQAGNISEGAQANAAKSLGLTNMAISKWVTAGSIPFSRQCVIDLVTKGRLKADPEEVKRHAKIYKDNKRNFTQMR